MAEIKNNFLRSKMNKDLDDRLIPNGEYRDAQNISVGKSEEDDIGALEIILGNSEITATNLATAPISAASMKVIGYVTNENKSTVYVFATNYEDTNGPEYTTQPIFIGSDKRCIIYSWNLTEPTAINIILDSTFLNFSITNPIQSSIIEDLLFFTDNRNQPRKINITKPLGYYTNESQISVAKFSPYEPISLIEKVKTTAISNGPSTFNYTDTASQGITGGVEFRGDNNTLPAAYAWAEFGAGQIKVTKTSDGSSIADSGADALLSNYTVTTYGPGTWNTYTFPINVTTTVGLELTFTCPPLLNQIVVTDVTGIKVGMQLVSTDSTGANQKIVGSDFVYVTAIDTTTNIVTILSYTPLWVGVTVLADDILYFLSSSMSDKSWDSTWPGDPDYLEDKFVRFSYRFQFDDGEYSLMAPFTQIAYVPKQDGYFFGSGESEAGLNDATAADENATYRSTVVEFMENSVNNVELYIPLPEIFPATGVTTRYKIKNLEVLYKESDALIVKILDTLTVGDVLTSSINNICTYDYQSRKPYKTLTEEQTVRVYDKVPVRALVQETAGSRIIYGNYTDRYTPPNNLQYEVKVTDKSATSLFNNWKEYPNHTLKENRTYQVGFVLADKYGRQSPVILSPVSNQKTSTYSGSTIYSPYKSSTSNIKNWFGDALQLTITEKIEGGTTGEISQPNFLTGTPGLYAIRTGDGNGFNTFNATSPSFNATFTEYTFILTFPVGTTPPTLPAIGTYLRGKYVDFVKVIATTLTGTPVSGTSYTITADGAINTDIYEATEPASPDLKYAYTLNETGWYSYKIVIKQTEQDYYNVYLPGILDGYPNQITTVPSPNPGNISIPPPFPTDEDGKTANIILLNDNINKIPRDLSEVGPDQKQFRSSVQLFGRVENSITTTTGIRSNAPTPVVASTALEISVANSAIQANWIVTGTGVINTTWILSVTSPTEFVLSQNATIEDGTVLTFTEADAPVSGYHNVLTFNKQYFPGITTATAINISTADDSNMTPNTLEENSGQKNLYQIDTNPLIARLSTPTSIGVTTGVTDAPLMTPILAIYETEPVESLLDIFWETTSEGLIADLNVDIDNGFTGPNSLTPDGFLLNESKVDGDEISQYFWPVTQEGDPLDDSTRYTYMFLADGSLPPVSATPVEIPQTYVNSAGVTQTNWSVSTNLPNLNSLSNADGTDKFILEYLNDSISSFGYGYRLKLNLNAATDNFIFKHGSSSEVYTFNFTFNTNDSPSVVSTVPLLGSLANITPSILNAFSQIWMDPTEGWDAANPIIDYSILPIDPGVNGTSNSTKTDDLHYAIVGGNTNNYFTLTSTGQLFQTGGRESIPFGGTYTLNITITDATLADGTIDTGNAAVNGSISIARTQIISLGSVPINSGVVSSCIATTVPATTFPSALTSPVNQFTTPNQNDTGYTSPSFGQTVSGIWYISSNTYTGYGTLAGEINNGLTGADQIPLVGVMGTENNGDPWKLGTVLTQGIVAFSCNMAQNNATTQIPNTSFETQLQSTAQFKVFHRLENVTPQPWVQIPDINNNILPGPGNAVPSDRGDGTPSQPYVIETGNLNINNQSFTSYAQIVFAFDEPGEYAVLLDEGATYIGLEDNMRMVAWCNSSDLNHSTCVVEGGSKINNGVIQPYLYGVSGGSEPNNGGNTTPSCLWATNSIWSPIPYGEYVNQFFTDNVYSTSWKTIGGDIISDETNYYTFKSGTVYVQNNTSNLFSYASRFSAADGKKFPTTGGTSCYALYVPAVCTVSNPPVCEPVIRKFPYELNS